MTSSKRESHNLRHLNSQ